MGYGISPVRTQPGLTAAQTLEWMNACCDPSQTLPPFELDDAAHQAVHQIQQRLAGLGLSTEVETWPTHVDIATNHPRVRLEWYGDSADIHIPYWYHGADAVRAMETAYAIGAVAEQETGLTAIDHQTGAGLSADQVRGAVELYEGTMGRLPDILS